MNPHTSVLLEETIDNLNIKSDGKYVDCTLGYGGHSSRILEKLETEGFLFAFDQDEEAIKYSRERLNNIKSHGGFKIIYSNFKNIKEYIKEPVDGIIYDLGVSSPQLDDETRGFSYHNDARLDMRMDKNASLSAYEVVNTYSYEKLVDIFFSYGEEQYAKSIAKNIVSSRPIETTLELVDTICKSVPDSYKRKGHPGKKVFQAIRIEVNGELAILEESLLDAFELLKKGGRMCVITFHSLEDRIVKKVFAKLSNDELSDLHLPISAQGYAAKAKLITKKPILPSENELENNRRSRSAKLRVIEKL